MIRVTVELLPSTNGERKTLRVMDISNVGDGFTVKVDGERAMHSHAGIVGNPERRRIPVWELVRLAIVALKLDKELL